MNTVVIINLDYEALPIVKCKQIWALIEERMALAGFTKNNRLFLTSMSSDTSYKQARGVIDSIEEDFQAKGESVLPCIREFYGIPYSHIVNLAAPSAQEIEVDLLATGAFQKFFT